MSDRHTMAMDTKFPYPKLLPEMVVNGNLHAFLSLLLRDRTPENP
jgi:hypothetical protein